MPDCRDCEYRQLLCWAFTDELEEYCSRKVYTSPTLEYLNRCVTERRESDGCGPEGKFFKEKKEE